jgi:hypothetical protein
MNDHKLVFEQSDVYRTILVNQTSKNFLLVKATDDDCTNDGKACAYKILEESIPFTVDELGFLSNTVPLAKSRYDFTVRAYDCLDDESYVDASIHIDVDEQCVPVWQGAEANLNVVENPNPKIYNLPSLNLYQAQSKDYSIISYPCKLYCNKIFRNFL